MRQITYKDKQVTLRPRSDSWLFSLIDKFTSASYWTTIGNTVYFPNGVNPDHCPDTVKHELVHVDQQRKWTVPIFLFAYICLPFPILGAYCRAKWEAQAYAREIALDINSLDEVTDTLFSFYAWPLPKPALRAVLRGEVERYRSKLQPKN